MKNFRKAALAIATASSVALGGTAVASAQTEGPYRCPLYGSEEHCGDKLTNEGDKTKNYGDTLNPTGKISGAKVFGPQQIENQPGWWILTKTLSFTAVVGAIAGVGIAIGNYLKNQGIII